MNIHLSGALLAVLSCLAAAPALARAPDPATGRVLYDQRCAMCHGQNGAGGPIGPKLVGVYGARAATQAGQKYSPALKASKLRWSAASLDAYLKSPQTLVRGTQMMVSVAKPEDRRNIVAYLNSLGQTATGPGRRQAAPGARSRGTP